MGPTPAIPRAQRGPREMLVGAVTGTNGKTSVVEYARQLSLAAGQPSMAMGTLGLTSGGGRDPDWTAYGNQGTATALDRARAAGMRAVFFEAVSVALAQRLLDDVPVHVAGFTNLSHDHLDEHGSLERYLAAKLRLFGFVLTYDGVAVVNPGAPGGEQVLDVCHRRRIETVTYGSDGDLRVVEARPQPGGSQLTLVAFGERLVVDTPFVTPHQVANALCALGMVVAGGLAPARGCGMLQGLEDPPGRLETLRHPNGARVVIDYAHNPGGLETTLRGLRELTSGWLIVVFGCGGERDRDKRQVMGSVAAQFADVVIVTDDNPRSEDPAEIRRQVLAGCPDAYEFADRCAAIEAACDFVEPADTLLVAGKGEERDIIYAGGVLPHTDVEAVRSAFARHLLRAGAESDA